MIWKLSRFPECSSLCLRQDGWKIIAASTSLHVRQVLWQWGVMPQQR